MNKIIFFFFLFISAKIFSQDASIPISDVVNTYSEVSDYRACDNSLKVVNNSSFSAGDDVLIIQMKGAGVDISNNKYFGNVLNYNNAGNYEFNTVASKKDDRIILQNKLSNTYDIPNGVVQIIRVAKYANATVNGKLTCMSWDGTKGGVLVLSADNLSFNGYIDVSGKGFRGGTKCFNTNADCDPPNIDYFYAVSSGRGAEKGESICMADPQKDGGMGAWANGGGGGNKLNAGGGGGSNFSAGGKGGNATSYCTILHVGGEGGAEMQYKHNKIFLGGGGGCSDNNDNEGTPGSNGGGIVIIRAKVINGNNDSIVSNGSDVPVKENAVGDGAGGGGAGGVVFLDCETVLGTLKIDVNGGSGGNQNAAVKQCFGTGGGGGTGVVIMSKKIASALIISSRPGNPGRDLYANSPCYFGSYGAFSGNFGKGILYDKTIVASAIPFTGNKNQAIIINKTADENVTLNARAGTKYSWSPASNLSSASIQNPVNSAKTDMTYIVQIFDDAGCFVADTFKIFARKDSVPVAVKPTVKNDSIPVAIISIHKKDSLPVAIKPVVKKDSVPVVVKPVVKKSAAKKDSTIVAAAPILKKDISPQIKIPVANNDSINIDAKAEVVKKALVTRTEKVESTLRVTGDSLEVLFYDDGVVDGDSISLYLNNQLIFQHLRLSNKAFTQKIYLKGLPKENAFTVVAENLGSIPPNTAYVQIKAANKTYAIYISSDENNNAIIKLIRDDVLN
jgi:hypothetical protein